MPLFVFPPNPDAPANEPGHALWFDRPLCQLDHRVGPGTTRTYELAAIACPECQQIIKATSTRQQLRDWLIAHGPGLTRGVRWLASEYRCSEDAVWRWLSGRRPLPGWLERELRQHAAS